MRVRRMCDATSNERHVCARRRDGEPAGPRKTGGVFDSTVKAKNLEKMFDEGKDVAPHLELSRARRPGHEKRRVNVDFPSWIIESLDAQASRLGVTR